MDDDPTTLAAVLVAAIILLAAGLMIGERPWTRRIGRWRQPPSPVAHDDLALVVLIALAVAFCLLNSNT